MELQTYLRILQRRKWIVLAFFCVAVAAAIAVVNVLPPSYTATSVMRISPTSTSIGYSELLYLDRVMNTYAELATSAPITAQLRERLQITPEEVPEITIEVVAESELFRISAESSDPALARDAANELAQILLNERISTGIRTSILELASLPRPPGMFTYLLYVVLGAVVGLGGGIGLALAFGVSSVLSRSLTGVEAGDPLAFIGATFVLVGVAGIAAFVPARRALKVDPASTLQAE